MHFTEKEIELAIQLKETLEWKPSFGDVVLIKDELLTRKYQNVLKWRGLTENVDIHDVLSGNLHGLRNTPKDYFTSIVIGTDIINGYIDIAVWNSRKWIASFADTTWLPLWHQCREILRCKDYLVEMSESTARVILRVMKDGKQYSFCGETDLEVMYKALLTVTCKRQPGKM